MIRAYRQRRRDPLRLRGRKVYGLNVLEAGKFAVRDAKLEGWHDNQASGVPI